MSGLKIGDGKGMSGDIDLYAYMNDDHIDTALRYLAEELTNRPIKKSQVKGHFRTLKTGTHFYVKPHEDRRTRSTRIRARENRGDKVFEQYMKRGDRKKISVADLHRMTGNQIHKLVWRDVQSVSQPLSMREVFTDRQIIEGIWGHPGYRDFEVPMRSHTEGAIDAIDHEEAEGADVKPAGKMDHVAYPKGLRTKPDASLDYIAKDAQAAMQAQPDGPKSSYYADEIAYVANEKNRRVDVRHQISELYDRLAQTSGSKTRGILQQRILGLKTQLPSDYMAKARLPIVIVKG
jgi:hypothetical protein